MKIDNNHFGRLFWLISQIEAQYNMVGFVVGGHHCLNTYKIDYNLLRGSKDM